MGTQQQPDQPGQAMTISERPQVPVAQAETSSTAVAARETALVQAKFLMALKQPRNPDLARQRLMVRCQSPRFAEVAEYKKPVGGGKQAQGGSIRLMEEIARQWGNIDVQSTIVFDDPERRTVTVTATDLETNYSQSQDVFLSKTVERRAPRDGDVVLRSRTNSQGHTVYLIVADEDAFLVKQNANIAKTRREMIRAVVPGDLVEEAIDETRQTKRDRDAKDPRAARKAIADAFFQLGVMANQLTELLDVQSLEAITPAQLEYLRQIYTGIREGETTWKEVIDEARPTRTADTSQVKVEGKGTSGLKSALKKNAPAPAQDGVAAQAMSDEDSLALDARLAAEENQQS